MIRHAALLALASLSIAPALLQAKTHVGNDCDLDSGYSFRIEPSRLVFTEDDSHRVIALLSGGGITVDGRALALDAADRARADELERGMRALVPEVKGIAIDAVAIAFEAVGHASTAFASTPAEARASAERIARTATELQKGIEAKQDWSAKADADLDRIIEGAVGTLVGELVGNVTAMALKVALSGDESAVAELEARAESIEKTVEKAVEKRSAELERRAETLCTRLHALDGIEAGIEARLPDGSRLDLVRITD
ncbi:MAG: DUF2884 family protein [Xanthomonadales bacterium]|nr:DUF2884 family protein [Xanthomonadales bacterium]